MNGWVYWGEWFTGYKANKCFYTSAITQYIAIALQQIGLVNHVSVRKQNNAPQLTKNQNKKPQIQWHT